MCVITINRLSMAEAESLIATLWCTLEEYRISSPQLNVRRLGDSMNLSIEFLSQQDADLVRQVMSRLTADAVTASTARPMLN